MGLFKMLFISHIVIILNISIVLCNNNNYVFFPLKRKDNSHLTNLKNITEIMKFIYLEPMVSELNIGSPEQNIDVIFRTDCTYTYITSNKHNISKPDQASEFIQLKYGNFKYFNEKESEHIYFYEKGYNFSRYAYNNQFFSYCISDNLKINDKSIKFDLMLANSIEYEEPGAICLQLEEESSPLQFTASFPVLLKKNYSLIDDYKWFIYYGKNNEKDYLVIGTSVDEFKNPESGNKVYQKFDPDNDYFREDDELDVHKAAMRISFDDIYLISDSKEKEKFEDPKNLKGKLVPSIGFIVGTTNYSEYLEKNVFGIYLGLNQCHKGIFSQRPNLVGEEYSYYFCDESLYNNIKSVFKNIIFKKVTFSEKFELTFDDLFLRQNGYLIFLVIFSTHQHFYWSFGTPFLKKYQFDFDFDKKKVGYYHIENKNIDGANKNETNIFKYISLIFLIIILAGILIVLGICLGKNYFKIRKKRANELDDDFDYKEKKEDNNNLLINN